MSSGDKGGPSDCATARTRSQLVSWCKCPLLTPWMWLSRVRAIPWARFKRKIIKPFGHAGPGRRFRGTRTRTFCVSSALAPSGIFSDEAEGRNEAPTATKGSNAAEVGSNAAEEGSTEAKGRNEAPKATEGSSEAEEGSNEAEEERNEAPTVAEAEATAAAEAGQVFEALGPHPTANPPGRYHYPWPFVPALSPWCDGEAGAGG